MWVPKLETASSFEGQRTYRGLLACVRSAQVPHNASRAADILWDRPASLASIRDAFPVAEAIINSENAHYRQD